MKVGTGKSTLVQHIIAAIGASSEQVVYCAFTGKATQVLSRKGCKNTSTLHKLLFYARLNPITRTYKFFPKPCLDANYKVIVVDEVSMVSTELWNALQKHKVYILALGDPGQLGPVKATEGSGILQHPHIFLDEIMRQEEGNEIIQFSMQIREGQQITERHGSHVKVIPPNELTTGMLEWADQILCATNATRFNLNMQMRELAGKSGDPEVGDKIICLKNSWEILSDDETPLTNGTLGWITEVRKEYYSALGGDVLIMSFVTELGDTYYDLMVDYKMLTQNVSSLSKTKFLEMYRKKKQIPLEFAFGYAVTCWKAQGSEWDNILLFEEGFPYKKEEHKRYLYTGVTRASQKVVVVQKS